MWTLIMSFVQGIVTGIVGPVFTYLGKKQDVTATGLATTAQADTAMLQTELTYEASITAIQAESSRWWGPRLLTFILLADSVAYITALTIDAIFKLNWQIGEPKGVLSTAIVMSISYLLLHTASHLAPINAMTSWMQKR